MAPGREKEVVVVSLLKRRNEFQTSMYINECLWCLSMSMRGFHGYECGDENRGRLKNGEAY